MGNLVSTYSAESLKCRLCVYGDAKKEQTAGSNRRNRLYLTEKMTRTLIVMTPSAQFTVFCLFVFLYFTDTPAFSFSDSIIYQQVVRRDDVNVLQAFKGTKGVLLLSVNSIAFRANRERAKEINFTLTYSQVKRVKRYRGMLIPNRIGIKTYSGETYRIFTYRRKRILATLESIIRQRG
jgi:hypothetical protein